MRSVRPFLKRNLRRLALLAPCAAAIGACDRPSYTYSDDVPVKGSGASSSFTGTSPIGGTGTTSTGGGPSVDPCAFSRTASGTPVLAGQVVRNQSVGRAEVYAELTDAEALALKQGGSLIPPPSPPPNQPSSSALPLTALLTQELSVTTGDRQRLVQELINRFPATRSTWPNPWALRLVDHPGSEHMNPLRIVFKPDALFIRITDHTPIVFDVKNAQLTPAQALLTPQRIVGVFYTSDAYNVGISTICETGKRELALGNEAMVESFSLGTKEILARLNSDIDDLNAFFQIARPCANVTNAMAMLQTFHNGIACGVWRFPDATTEYNAYGWSLSNPVELYKPTPQNLASLISALEADRFDVDPFVGTPPVSAGGDSGVGGADVGGAAAGGADSGFPQGGI
jgi:hypothetical protein